MPLHNVCFFIYTILEKSFWVSSDQRIIVESTVAVKILKLMENTWKLSKIICNCILLLNFRTCFQTKFQQTSDNFLKLSELSNFIFKSNSNTHDHQNFRKVLKIINNYKKIIKKVKNTYNKQLADSEEVVQKCSVKNLFFKISQNQQENTYPRVSFFIQFFF